jgi:glycerate-2-kinase
MTQHALAIVNVAIRAVDPWTAVKTHVKTNGQASLQIGSTLYNTTNYDKIILVAFGKASSAMARALVETIDQALPQLSTRGVVIVKDHHATQGAYVCTVYKYCNAMRCVALHKRG